MWKIELKEASEKMNELPLTGESSDVKNKQAGAVYILGSIHAADETIYPMKDVIMNAFEESDYLVVEADINNLDPFMVMNVTMYQDDNTLEGNVSKEIYTKMQGLFENNGLPELVYYKLKPWAAALMLAQLEMQKSGFEIQYGIDLYFMEKATQTKKPLLELESAEFQFNLFDELMSEGDAFIEYLLRDAIIPDTLSSAMMSAWKLGDTLFFLELIKEEIRIQPEFNKIYKRLVTKRNYSMAEKIEGYLTTGKKYFVITGAGHLVGDEGIINLLRVKGKYRIKQM
jgi:hypothetical protein